MTGSGNFYLIIAVSMLSFNSIFSQSNEYDDPSNSPLITSDITNFWNAFDLYEDGYNGNPFDSLYIRIGTKGLQDFIPHRIVSAENMLHKVETMNEQYLKMRESSLRIKDYEKKIRAVFFAMKNLYPEARFPAVYFVIGCFNSGGTSSDNGLIIGFENSGGTEMIPYIIAHELVHFQQRLRGTSYLLKQSIIEGSADFIGELISEGNINLEKYKYGDEHKDELCREFVEVMYENNYEDWLYSTSGKDDRPNDLGYWIGYHITKAYYNKTDDKKQAVNDILNIKDYKSFMENSGYLSDYLK